MAYKQPSSGPFKLMGSSPAKKNGGFNLSKLPKKTLLTTIGTFAAKKALGAAADMFLGNESLGKGSTLTPEQGALYPPQQPMSKAEAAAMSESLNKSFQKSMYKPLPKQTQK